MSGRVVRSSIPRSKAVSHTRANRALFASLPIGSGSWAVCTPPKPPAHLFAQLVADFARYLEEEKSLAPRTIVTRGWVAKDFLCRALQPKRDPHEITISQIDEVLAHKGTEGQLTCPPLRETSVGSENMPASIAPMALATNLGFKICAILSRFTVSSHGMERALKCSDCCRIRPFIWAMHIWQLPRSICR